MIWHSGAAEGMPSYMALLPDEGVGILVLTNSGEASQLRGEIANRLLDHWLGLPWAPQTPARAAPAASPAPPALALRPAADLQVYAGVYRDDLYGDITVTAAEARLALQVARGERADLEHLNGDSFRLVWRDPVYAASYPSSVTFRLDPAGEAEGLILRLAGELVDAARSR